MDKPLICPFLVGQDCRGAACACWRVSKNVGFCGVAGEPSAESKPVVAAPVIDAQKKTTNGGNDPRFMQRRGR
jgi:hypothetical protein